MWVCVYFTGKSTLEFSGIVFVSVYQSCVNGRQFFHLV